MIQDISPHKLDNAYKHCRAEADDRLLVYENGGFYIRITDGRISVPAVSDLPELKEAELTYLFSIDDKRYFLFLPGISGGRETISPEIGHHTVTEIRRTPLSPKEDVFALFTAYHLAEWYLSARFCGSCGRAALHDTEERAMICPDCGKKTYPRINPAVIIGVTNGDKLLLTRYNRENAHNALVAGFTEIGETAEETVSREVMEETGLRVKNIRYYKSQPWGVAADLLMGFYCDVDGEDTITMDKSELKYAEWVERSEILLQPLDHSLTNEMMRMFKEGKV